MIHGVFGGVGRKTEKKWLVSLSTDFEIEVYLDKDNSFLVSDA